MTALPALAVVAVVLTLLAVERQVARDDDAVGQVIEIEATVTRVLELVVDAETGTRGFVATGDAAFLEPEVAARRDLPAALDRLELLLAAQPGREPTAGLRGAVEEQLAALQGLKQFRADRDQSRAQLGASIRQEKTATDAIRRQIGILQRHERALRDERNAAHDRKMRRANVLVLAVAGLGVAGGVGGSSVLMTRLVRRVRHVEHNALLLAAGKPLLPVENEGTDEVASLANALTATGALIRDQQRRLQVALEVGRINVWEVDEGGRMRMQGDRADEYGDTLEAGLATLRPEHARLVRDGVEGVRRDGEPKDYEVQSIRDGRWFAGRLMQSSASEVIAVSVDVTALRAAQDELRESEVRRALDALAASEQRGRYNALVLGAASEAIAAIDARGVCISANPAAGRMLGYEVVEMIGRDLHALLHHSRPDGSPYPAEECVMRAAAVTGAAAHVEDEVFWRRDGTRVPVAYSVSPLSDGGSIRGAVVTFTDISARQGADAKSERTAAELRAGIRAGELVLHYQPKIDLRSGACASVEALVRWQRGDELVFPDDFIGVAERCGVIDELTESVIDAAAAQISHWNAQGVDLRVAVNLSALSLTDDHVVDVLKKAADEHRVPVSRLEIEITESAAAENPETVIAVLAKLTALNVRTAIDDFGTGFSSLSYLKHLPVSALKIDKSFVMNMPNDTRDQAIVASTVHMAHSLGMAVVAEGVENDLVARILRRAMCDVGQGYLWTRPLEPSRLVDWLASASVPTP